MHLLSPSLAHCFRTAHEGSRTPQAVPTHLKMTARFPCSTSSPVTRSLMISPLPPTSVATTARPAAHASNRRNRVAFGSGRKRENIHSRQQGRHIRPVPEKPHPLCKSELARRRSIACLCSPSPMITRNALRGSSDQLPKRLQQKGVVFRPVQATHRAYHDGIFGKSKLPSGVARGCGWRTLEDESRSALRGRVRPARCDPQPGGAAAAWQTAATAAVRPSASENSLSRRSECSRPTHAMARIDQHGLRASCTHGGDVVVRSCIVSVDDIGMRRPECATQP